MSHKNAALELVQTLLPAGSKYGILIDLETCFNIRIENNIDFNNGSTLNKRQLVVSLSESQSIANAETEDDDLSVGNSGKKSKKFNGLTFQGNNSA